jgi:hypothetical protein
MFTKMKKSKFRLFAVMLAVMMVFSAMPVAGGAVGYYYCDTKRALTTLGESPLSDELHEKISAAIQANPDISSEELQQIIGLESGIQIFRSNDEQLAYHENIVAEAKVALYLAELRLEEAILRFEEHYSRLSSIEEATEEVNRMSRERAMAGEPKPENWIYEAVRQKLLRLPPSTVVIMSNGEVITGYEVVGDVIGEAQAAELNLLDAQAALELAEFRLERILEFHMTSPERTQLALANLENESLRWGQHPWIICWWCGTPMMWGRYAYSFQGWKWIDGQFCAFTTSVFWTVVCEAACVDTYVDLLYEYAHWEEFHNLFFNASSNRWGCTRCPFWRHG